MEKHGTNGKKPQAEEQPVSFIPLTSLRRPEPEPDFSPIEARLAGKRGRAYWRSLEELAGSEQFGEYLEKEFPQGAPRDWAPLKRRDFMRLMGATLALAGVGGCAWQPPEKIVPYVDQPESLVPGKPLYYATAYTRGGYALGLLAESQMGRPVKLEGNPDHPASLGSTDALAQGSLLGLYDPDRSQSVRHMGGLTSWDVFLGDLASEGGILENIRRTRGAGLRILAETITSPTLTSQIQRLLKKYPGAKVCQYDPAGRESGRLGAQLAFGQELHPVYHFGPVKPTPGATGAASTPPGAATGAATGAGTPAGPGGAPGAATHTPAAPGTGPATAPGAAGARGAAGTGGARTAGAGAAAPGSAGAQAGATRILSLDSDFLWEEPGSVRYAREFAAGRRTRENTGQMNRLYVVESTPTITGANADHRLGMRPSEVEAVAQAIAAKLGVGGVSAPAALPPVAGQAWIDAVAEDLQSAGGSSLVIPGVYQSPRVHALAHAMNQKLGAVGRTVTYLPPVEARFAGRDETLKDLVAEMNGGQVQTLVILSGNPLYNAPADLQFGEALKRMSGNPTRQTIHLGLSDDETGVECQWHLPESHYLETWGDARAYDGTVTLVQPLITPLYDTHSPNEVLAMLLGEGGKSGLQIVQEYWQSTNPTFASKPVGKPSVANGTPAAGAIAPPPAFEAFWHRALTTGTVQTTPVAAQTPALKGSLGAAPAASAAGSYEIAFRPDPHIWDGRYANNAWLQELPKPITTLTWDNAALISAATAQQLGLVGSAKDAKALVGANGQLIEITTGAGALKVPVWVTPGQPDGTITLHLGYGRTRAGEVGNGTGFNAYLLRSSDSPWAAANVQVKKAPGSYRLANAQHHFNQEGRHIVRGGSFEELQQNPAEPPFMLEAGEEDQRNPDTLYTREWPSDRVGPTRGEGERGAAPGQPRLPEKRDAGNWNTRDWGNAYDPTNPQQIPAWGMVIDQTACIGCNACTIACQAENNIATVGKDMVAMHRQMHWIRIDHYFSGPLENPQPDFQPVPCMHCENAPCEPVCPVEATSHSAEGLNEMTYNRCIGTRYCQNNCPYKVRRFNFLQYSDQITPTIQLMRNPDVTVRSRGVMEKCSYCVQRINEARFQAEKEERPIRDGEVVPACAQVCPTEAIIFGNINDPNSRVRKLKEHPLEYPLLSELNTRPRTSYMARVRNPNPKLPEGAGSGTVWKGDF